MIIDELITDRTQADVTLVEQLAKKGWRNMSDTEKAQYRTNLKGAYNASDLNRVGEAINYIAERLASYGYVVSVSPKTDWAAKDTPTPTQMQRYLQDVTTLRNKLTVWQSTPQVPADMEDLLYGEANDIEKILVDIEEILTLMSQAWYYTGEIYTGEV
jgi:hypothetical protein